MVVTSEQKRREVFVGKLSLHLTATDLREFFKDKGYGVTRCDVLYDRDGKSKGCGFVEFVTYDEIDRLMQNRPYTIKGRTVDCRRTGLGKDLASNADTYVLFVGRLHECTKDLDVLRGYFSRFGEIDKVVIPTDRSSGKLRNFAQIYYTNTDSVDKAILAGSSHEVKGVELPIKKFLTPEEQERLQEKMEYDREKGMRRERSMQQEFGDGPIGGYGDGMMRGGFGMRPGRPGFGGPPMRPGFGGPMRSGFANGSSPSGYGDDSMAGGYGASPFPGPPRPGMYPFPARGMTSPRGGRGLMARGAPRGPGVVGTMRPETGGNRKGLKSLMDSAGPFDGMPGDDGYDDGMSRSGPPTSGGPPSYGQPMGPPGRGRQPPRGAMRGRGGMGRPDTDTAAVGYGGTQGRAGGSGYDDYSGYQPESNSYGEEGYYGGGSGGFSSGGGGYPSSSYGMNQSENRSGGGGYGDSMDNFGGSKSGLGSGALSASSTAVASSTGTGRVLDQLSTCIGSPGFRQMLTAAKVSPKSLAIMEAENLLDPEILSAMSDEELAALQFPAGDRKRLQIVFRSMSRSGSF